MALPRNDPHAMPQLPVEDERELLVKGTQGVASALTRQPILGTYLPVHPINRYTHKKWDTGDWSRHNEDKYFQANRDRDASMKYDKILISFYYFKSYIKSFCRLYINLVTYETLKGTN